MHRKYAALGHGVVHVAEDALFHLSGVFGAEDNELLLFDVQRDADLRVESGRVTVGREAPRVENDEIGFSERGPVLPERAV